MKQIITFICFLLMFFNSFSQNEKKHSFFMKGGLGCSNYFPIFLTYSGGIESKYFSISAGLLYDLSPAFFKPLLLPQEVNENPWGFQAEFAGPTINITESKLKLKPLLDIKFKRKVFQSGYGNAIYRTGIGNMETFTAGLTLEKNINKSLTFCLSPGAGCGVYQVKFDGGPQLSPSSGIQLNYQLTCSIKWNLRKGINTKM